MKRLYYLVLIIAFNIMLLIFGFKVGYSQLGNNEIMEIEDFKYDIDYKTLYLDLKEKNKQILELNEGYKQLAEARDLMYKDALYILYGIIDIETEKDFMELIVAIPDILQQHNIIEKIIMDEIGYIEDKYNNRKKI